MKKHTIFTTSIYTGNIDNIDNIQLEKEIESIYLNDLEKSKGVIKSNQGGWQSDLISLQDFEKCQILQYLLNHLGKQCADVAREWELGTDCIDFTGAWININGKNQFNWPHVHTRNTLSMVYYVRCNGQSGNLIFERPDALKLCINTPKINDNINTLYTVVPESGKFVIFPSYLSHYVTPNYSDDYRISISANLYVS